MSEKKDEGILVLRVLFFLYTRVVFCTVVLWFTADEKLPKNININITSLRSSEKRRSWLKEKSTITKIIGIFPCL